MSAWIRSVTGRAYQFFVPIAQSTERARPKRQVAGESPAGDANFCRCGSTAECGRAKAETTVRFRSPAPFRVFLSLRRREQRGRPLSKLLARLEITTAGLVYLRVRSSPF